MSAQRPIIKKSFRQSYLERKARPRSRPQLCRTLRPIGATPDALLRSTGTHSPERKRLPRTPGKEPAATSLRRSPTVGQGRIADRAPPTWTPASRSPDKEPSALETPYPPSCVKVDPHHRSPRLGRTDIGGQVSLVSTLSLRPSSGVAICPCCGSGILGCAYPPGLPLSA